MPRAVIVSFVLFVLFCLVPTLALADDLAAIQQSGELSFALTGQYPPFNFVDENNQLTGFDIEICQALARELGVRPRPVTTAWDGIVAGLLAGKYDLICGSMAITEQRLQAIDFSDPYYRSGAQLFVGRNAGIDSAQQLKGKTVGVTLGTTYEAWVRNNLPQTRVRTYKGVPEMILEVVNRRIAGFVTDRIVGAIAIDDKQAPIQMAGPLLYQERMGIALRQGNPELKQAINAALQKLKQQGDYRAISLKWLKIDAR
jgi:polar amino acid transport system substrate-binding protein